MAKVVHVSGSRKKAIARATLKEGTGKVKINDTMLDAYEPQVLRVQIREPLTLAGDLAEKVDIQIKIHGGGISSQAEAARLAIGRALNEYFKSEKLKKTLLNYDRHLLIADVRQREPNKPNVSKARKKRQKSYR